MLCDVSRCGARTASGGPLFPIAGKVGKRARRNQWFLHFLARYVWYKIAIAYLTFTGHFRFRFVKRIVSAPAPLPLIFAVKKSAILRCGPSGTPAPIKWCGEKPGQGKAPPPLWLNIPVRWGCGGRGEACPPRPPALPFHRRNHRRGKNTARRSGCPPRFRWRSLIPENRPFQTVFPLPSFVLPTCVRAGACPPFMVYSASFSSSVLALAARPASPWISLGIMILVALPSAIFCMASNALSLMT